MTGTRALVLLMVLVTSSRVLAQSPRAKTLFDEGKALLDAGEIEQACAKFEASEQAEARDATEMNLALCWDKLGRTASAYAMYVKVAGAAQRDDRATTARKRAKALQPKLIHLTIEVPADAELDDLVITRNGQVVDRAQWNQPVPVDPDDYTITAKAADHEEWSKKLAVRIKDKTVEVPKLERATVTKPRKPKPEPDQPNANRALSIGLIAGGGGAIVIATGFALHSRSLQNESDKLCPTVPCVSRRAVDLNAQARKEGWIANIGWGLGGAAVAAAIVTWSLGARKPDRAVAIAPVISSDQAGVAVGGRF